MVNRTKTNINVINLSWERLPPGTASCCQNVFVAFLVDLNVLQIGVGRMNFRNTVQLREQNLKGKAAIETC